MNSRHQDSGAPTDPLIFTLPAFSFVVVLSLDWLDGLGPGKNGAKQLYQCFKQSAPAQAKDESIKKWVLKPPAFMLSKERVCLIAVVAVTM